MFALGMGIAVIVLAGLGISGKGRYLIKGTANLFFTDVAKTPKGAEAIYTQAIEEAQNNYNKASNNLQRIAGLLDTSQKNYNITSKKIGETKANCEMLCKKGKFDEADLFADELMELEEDLVIYQNEIIEYTPMLEEAKTLCQNGESKLRKLQKDKKTVVRKLEINQQTKQMYDSMDELKNVKSSDKLLNAVKEGVLESGEMATGAKILHESKHSTKMLEAEKAIKKEQKSAYIEELKQKYQK